jgi:hypothetical protein
VRKRGKNGSKKAFLINSITARARILAGFILQRYAGIAGRGSGDLAQYFLAQSLVMAALDTIRLQRNAGELCLSEQLRKPSAGD